MHLRKLILLVVIVGSLMGLALFVAGAVASRQPDDRSQIAGVVREYFEGWYAADPAQVARSLHPDMVKRCVDALPGGRQVVHSVTRDVMVEMTRTGGGSKTPPERWNIVVDVLDVSDGIAVARVSSSEYLEYLSLAKCNGQWTIINILWRFQKAVGQPR